MKCPVCQSSLEPTPVADVTVDVCRSGCGGIWFDNFELQKFDEPHEVAHPLLIKVTPRADLPADLQAKRTCPRCDDMIMMRHFFSARQRVEVDECPHCGGYWLDAGELALIREEHQGEVEKRLAAEKCLAEAAASLAHSWRSGDGQEAVRARRIAGIFRFSGSIQFQSALG